MIFVLLTFLSAFLIEGLGTLVSVIGLSALFGSNPIIIGLVIALDMGKLVTVSLLYTHWKSLPVLMKSYALVAAVITMIITSTGAAGYLSSEFQRAIVGTQESSLKIDVLKQQQAKYEERKKQIDAQIAALPDRTSVNQRLRLMNGFKTEQQELQAKINQIDTDLPALQVTQIGVEAHAGPILYIAKAFNVSVEVAVKYVILLIIFVFDPLAIFLIIAGNFLLAKRRKQDEENEKGFVQAPKISLEAIRKANERLIERGKEARKDAKRVTSEEEQEQSEILPARPAEEHTVQSTVVLEDQAQVTHEPKILAEEPVKAMRIDDQKLRARTAAVGDASFNSEPVPAAFVRPAEPPREKITMNTLRRRPENVPHSSLADVEPDHTVEFEDTPPSSSVQLYNPKK